MGILLKSWEDPTKRARAHFVTIRNFSSVLLLEFLSFTLELEMKKQLAVFDFDKTISGFLVDQEGEIQAHDVIFTDGQLPSDFKEMVGDWEAVRKYKMKTLNSRNLTKDQVWDILGQLLERTRTLIDGMDKVIEYLYKVRNVK